MTTQADIKKAQAALNGLSAVDIHRAYERLNPDEVMQEVQRMIQQMSPKVIDRGIQQAGSKDGFIERLISIAAKKIVIKLLLVAGGLAITDASALADGGSIGDLADIGCEGFGDLAEAAPEAASGIFDLISGLLG
jgi:hypothetical protein